MKIEFNHDNGSINQDIVLCEVFGYAEPQDDPEELLKSGWLPESSEDAIKQNKWYQSRSIRLVCEPCIDMKRKKRKRTRISWGFGTLCILLDFRVCK